MRLKPLSAMPKRGNYWKVDETIRHCLDRGFRKFIIYPYGEVGLLIKNVLNDVYNIKETLIVDEAKAKYNNGVVAYEDFTPTDYHEDAVLLLATVPPTSAKTYLKAIKKMDPDRVICPFDDSLNVAPPFPKKVSPYLDASRPGLVKLSFVGDLILLENMVKSGRREVEEAGYDFSDMFKHTRKYLEDSDLSIGVLEGPCCNDERYTQGNFSDPTPLTLNFPKQFLRNIKEAGIGLVTTCNNHSFDRGEKGLLDTLDNLDEVGLDHVGTYRNDEEKSKGDIRTVKGLNIGFLAYTYGFNASRFNSKERWERHARKLTAPDEPGFDDSKAAVASDIRGLKKQCDMVVVLSHMGKDFTHEISDYERIWSEVFFDSGADIMFNCHAHAVKPVGIKDGRLAAFGPGNYVNSFVKWDGDANAIIEAYIDANRKKVVASSVIPIVTRSDMRGTMSAIPAPDLYGDGDLRSNLSIQEGRIIERTSAMITKIMTGVDMPTSCYHSCRPVVTEEGAGRTGCRPLRIENLRDNPFLKALEGSKSVCFVGDSITEGTENGGIPWYEPLMSNFPDMAVTNVSKGGITSKGLLEMLKPKRIEAEIAVIAVGCNDIRYRSKAGCMTSSEYVMTMNSIVSMFKKSAKEVFVVSPWPSTRFDPYCKVSEQKKLDLYDEYVEALADYCATTGVRFSNPCPSIRKYFDLNLNSPMLVDHIHPSARGTELYSRMFLDCMHRRHRNVAVGNTPT